MDLLVVDNGNGLRRLLRHLRQSGSGDGDRLVDSGYLQFDFERHARACAQGDDVGSPAEPVPGHFDDENAGGKVFEAIVACGGRHRSSRNRPVLACQPQRGTWYTRVLSVGHAPGQHRTLGKSRRCSPHCRDQKCEDQCTTTHQ